MDIELFIETVGEMRRQSAGGKWNKLPSEEHRRRLVAYAKQIAAGVGCAAAAQAIGVSYPSLISSARTLRMRLPHPAPYGKPWHREIVAFYQAHPELSGRAVAKHFGISAAALSKMLITSGVRTKARPRQQRSPS